MLASFVNGHIIWKHPNIVRSSWDKRNAKLNLCCTSVVASIPKNPKVYYQCNNCCQYAHQYTLSTPHASEANIFENCKNLFYLVSPNVSAYISLWMPLAAFALYSKCCPMLWGFSSRDIWLKVDYAHSMYGSVFSVH